MVTRAGTSIEGSFYLITSGRRIGYIKTIGPSLDETLAMQSTNSLDTATSELDKEFVIDQVNNALVMYASRDEELSKEPSTLRYVFKFDNPGYNHNQTEKLKRRLDRVLHWRKLNGGLVVGKRNVGDLARGFTASNMVKDKLESFSGTLARAVAKAAIEGAFFSFTDNPPPRSYVRPANDGPKLIRPELVSALEAFQELVDEGLTVVCITKGFHVGWAHPNACPGDEVFLLTGCSMPDVLRASSTFLGTYSVVGHAYLSGVMDGKYWDRLSQAVHQTVVLTEDV